MTIVVVRDEPAGSSGVAASALAADAGFAASAVAGAAVEEALADAAVSGAVATPVGFGAPAGRGVDCEKAAGETSARARRRAEIAGHRFMIGETIGRARMRQAAEARGASPGIVQ
jgi:hypothetical protein